MLVFSGSHSCDADILLSKYKNEVERAVRYSSDFKADDIVDLLADWDHSLTRGQQNSDITSGHAVNADVGVEAHLCGKC